MTLIEETLEIIKAKGGSATIDDICETYCKKHHAYFDRNHFIPAFTNLLNTYKKLVHYDRESKLWVLGRYTTKYYVEFVSIEGWERKEIYFAQSVWFETIRKCIEFVEKWVNFHLNNFDYQDFTYNAFRYYVLCADFDEEDNYGDIEQVGEIIFNSATHKFDLHK